MLRCSKCETTNQSSRDAAEFVLGWRFWTGTTMGGEQRDVSLCPTCSGCGPQPLAPAPGWAWECHTCHALHEPWGDDPPLTEKEAREAADDHQCDPDIRVYEIKPEKPAVVNVLPLAGVL